MLDVAEEGCPELGVDSLFVLEYKALEMLDDGDSSTLVKDLGALEDKPLVVFDGSFLVLVEVNLLLEDNRLVVLDVIFVDRVFSIVLMLVEDFVMPVERNLVLENFSIVLDVIFPVLDEIFLVLVEILLVLVELF
jgi:hypothetical protein